MKSISKLFKHAIKISNDEEFRKVPFTAQAIGEIVIAMMYGHHSIVIHAGSSTSDVTENIANFCKNHNLTSEFIEGEYSSQDNKIVISWL